MSQFEYRKSSYSNGSIECVEIALNRPGTVAVRDSKDPHSPILHFSPTAWQTFCSAVSRREFDVA
jgi:hypothetical protein